MTTETKATHTPGPWTSTANAFEEEGTRYRYVEIVNGDQFPIASLYCATTETRECDVHLICAAPELLAALTITRGQWIHSVHAAQCLAAIAKATGQPTPAAPLCIHGREVCGICAESQQ